MAFCPECVSRHARCNRRCDRLADGEHLWGVIQADLRRGISGPLPPHLAFDRQAGDVRHAMVAGAQAMREMAR